MASYRAIIITVSDGVAAGAREDVSGSTADALLVGAGYDAIERLTVPDERADIETALRRSAEKADLIVTTGGTGFGPRDVTPEATRAVLEREAPGLSELMRAEGLKHTPMAALSRGVCGTLGETLIVNLPGSPKAVDENLSALLPVLPHVLQTLHGDTRHGNA